MITEIDLVSKKIIEDIEPMKKYDYILYSIEVDRIELELELLDPTNCFDAQMTLLLQLRLDEILAKIKKSNKAERLNKFKLLEGGVCER